MKFILTYNISLNKRRSKVQEKNMSCERALNFDQWKTFSENYKPMRVWLWLVYKISRELLSLATFLRLHSNSKEVPYLSWQNTSPNLKSTCHIKLKNFLWTKLLENLLHAKYLISVAAPLNWSQFSLSDSYKLTKTNCKLLTHVQTISSQFSLLNFLSWNVVQLLNCLIKWLK